MLKKINIIGAGISGLFLGCCLKKNNFSRIPVIVGGIIPPSDEKKLKSFGVKEVFTPKDFKIEEIMKQITQIIKEAY